MYICIYTYVYVYAYMGPAIQQRETIYPIIAFLKNIINVNPGP